MNIAPEVLPSRTDALEAVFTLRARIGAFERRMEVAHYLTTRFTLTETARSSLLFLAGHRYVVDRAARRLTPVEDGRQKHDAAAIRAMIGEIDARRAPGIERTGGHECVRLVARTRGGRMDVRCEALIARLPGLERTALAGERELDARAQPFVLPIDPDEVVVRSTTHLAAGSFRQTQSYELLAIERGIDGLEDADALLGFTIAPGGPG